MKTIDKITFESPINIDNGYVNIPQGDHESTMELFSFYDGDCVPALIQIEWVVESLDIVEHIGIEWEEGTMKVTGYDGVFELPEQAIKLLEKNGFDCTEVK